MNTWSAWLAPWLLDFSLLATIVLALAIVLTRCFRDPARRVALVWGTWLGLIALAVLTALPQWPRFALTSASYEPVADAIEAPRELILLPSEASAPAERINTKTVEPVTPVAPPNAASARRWPGVLAIGWLALAGLTAAWFAIGLAQTQRLVRASETAPAWIEQELAKLVGRKRRAPSVRISRRLTTAAAVGALAPRILLPQEAECPSQQSIVRAALAHEWAHIRHGDLWLLAIERLLAPLLVWQPLWWWLRRGVRQDLELLADAAAAGDDPVEYAEALVAWAKSASAAPAGLAALSLWESPHTLSRRVTMLLDPKRTPAPPAGRGWQVLLILSMIGAIAGLSSFTLRPHSAVGQESAKPAAVDGALPVTDKPATAILLRCLVLEADRAELDKLHPVEDKPQPSPDLDVAIRTPRQWEETLARLATSEGTAILSRPQVITIDGSTAVVEIAGHLPAEPKDSSKARASMRIHLTPRMTEVEGERKVVLEVDATRDADDQKQQIKTTVLSPLDQTVVIANRRQGKEIRPLVLAIEVRLSPATGEAAANPQPAPPPPDLRRASIAMLEKLLQDAQQATDKPGEVSERELQSLRQRLKALTQLPAADKTQLDSQPLELRRLIADLQKDLERRTREAQTERERNHALQKQLDDLKAQLDKLAAAAPVRTNTIIRLKYAKAADVQSALKELLDDTRRLGGDVQVESIQVQAEPSTNSLIVSAQSRHWEAIRDIVTRLDRPASRANEGASVTSRQVVAEPASGLSVDRQTQVELLKLDLQEAEIGLQAAQKDMDRVQSLRERGVISQEEIAKHEYQLKSAEIKVMRAKILLQGSMRQLLAPRAEPKPAQAGEAPKPATSTPR